MIFLPTDSEVKESNVFFDENQRQKIEDETLNFIIGKIKKEFFDQETEKELFL
jgi:hypothetical protein